MKTLVIGASGQIGKSIYNYLISEVKGAGVFGTYFSFLNVSDKFTQLDIFDSDKVKNLMDLFKPDIVFLPGAITNVDQCESNPLETYKINVLGTKNVVDAMDEKCKIVFFSSDFVFDGEQGLYDEDNIPNPINEYGKQKLLAEHYIASHAKDFLIIRTNGVFGPDDQKKNFVSRLVDNLIGKDSEAIFVPKDEFGTPTYAPNLAEHAVKLAMNGECGIYNLTGPQLMSRYKLAMDAAEIFGLDKELIRPVQSSELKRPAKRPLSAGLITKKYSTPLMNHVNGLLAMKKLMAY